jgi:hypothetical protein
MQIEAKTQIYPSGRISINRGSRVNFDINTFDKLENGMSKIDFTEIKIDYKDTDDQKGWELTVQADAGYTDIAPYFGGLGLPLGIIEIEATFNPPFPPAYNVFKKTLSSASELIANDVWPLGPGVEKTVSYTVNISYFCNQGSTFVNFGDYLNDTYIVELYFTLQRIP